MKIWESQCAVSKKWLVKCFNVNKYDSETDQFKVSWSDALITKQQSKCRKCLSWTMTSNNQHDWIPLKYVNILHMIVTIWRNLRRLSTSGKINFIFQVFLEILQSILQRYCERIILGTLGMPAYTHPKWYHQVVENLNVYLHIKNKLHHSFLSWDIF